MSDFKEYPHETALRLKREAAVELYDALDMCRCIIKFHVKDAQACCSFSPDSEPFSALDAYKAAVTALDRASPNAS